MVPLLSGGVFTSLQGQSCRLIDALLAARGATCQNKLPEDAPKATPGGRGSRDDLKDNPSSLSSLWL